MSFAKSTLGASTGGRSVETHQRNIEAQATPYPHTCGKCGAHRIDSQLGLEPTPEEYVANLVGVFREVRRVLRDDGTVWLNLGDSYASGGGGLDRTPEQMNAKGTMNSTAPIAGRAPTPLGLKPKDLVGIPWRVAFALQADGWYLRSDIIWAKPNPMPESVTDRPTKSHEYVFLLTKSARYYWDADAVREDGAGRLDLGRMKRPEARLGEGSGWANDNGFRDEAGRNIRSVWSIATEPFPGSHFAVFPKKLVEPCVKAGTSEKGCCGECGEPFVRMVERQRVASLGEIGGTPKGEAYKAAGLHSDTSTIGRSKPWTADDGAVRTLGWSTSCGHVGEPVPCTVLDPFAGSGTVGVVAARLGRSFVGIELNPDYAEMARERIRNDGPLFNVQSEVSA